jgi:transcriptional regulator with XRE-family HTH domain
LLLLGEAIRGVPVQQGLSVSELAAATGVAEARIVTLENGQLDPDFELLLTPSESMGVRPSTFVLRAESLGSCGGEI